MGSGSGQRQWEWVAAEVVSLTTPDGTSRLPQGLLGSAAVLSQAGSQDTGLGLGATLVSSLPSQGSGRSSALSAPKPPRGAPPAAAAAPAAGSHGDGEDNKGSGDDSDEEEEEDGSDEFDAPPSPKYDEPYFFVPKRRQRCAEAGAPGDPHLPMGASLSC